MLTTENIEYMRSLSDKKCICVDKGSEKAYTIYVNNSNVDLRHLHKLYKVKSIEMKNHGKYIFKATCREIGSDTDAIKIFKMNVYTKQGD